MAVTSVLDRMNLPDGFGYLLLVLALILTLAPWFHGQDFGLLKIPDFAPRTRRVLLLVGPLALLLAVGLHAPLHEARSPPLPPAVDPVGDEEERSWIETVWASLVGRPDEVAATEVAATTDPAWRPASASNRVLAEWQGTGCLFPARVVERGSGTATLLFDFGEEAVMAVGEVFVATDPEIKIGASAYARLPNREGWLPITIRDIRTSNAQVRADPDAGCAIEFEKPLRWVPIEELIAASPIGDAS